MCYLFISFFLNFFHTYFCFKLMSILLDFFLHLQIFIWDSPPYLRLFLFTKSSFCIAYSNIRFFLLNFTYCFFYFHSIVSFKIIFLQIYTYGDVYKVWLLRKNMWESMSVKYVTLISQMYWTGLENQYLKF